MIRPINFTGIKNIGYTKSNSYPKDYQNYLSNTKYTMNMQLTDDENGKELQKYMEILSKNPKFINRINHAYLNIEADYMYVNDNTIAYVEKINGIPVDNSEENIPIRNFSRKLVSNIAKAKISDIKTDDFHKYTQEAQLGLIQKERILDYISGAEGTLDILENSGLAEKFAHYDKMEHISEKDAKTLAKAVLNIIDVLHSPQYVKNGAMIRDSILKTPNNTYKN